MDIKRTILYIALAAVAAMLWAQWQHEHPATQVSTPAQTVVSDQPQDTSSSSADESYVPTTSHVTQTQQQPVVGPKPTTGRQTANSITVKTDVLNVAINPVTGDLVGASLLDYPVSLSDPKQAVEMLSNSPGSLYELQSGVVSHSGGKPIALHAQQSHYELQPGQDQVTVALTGTAGGVAVQKTYVFYRGKYGADLTTKVSNQGQQDWTGQVYQQITRQNVPSSTHHIRSYDGAAISSPQTPYQKVSYKDMDEKPLQKEVLGGWLAMQQPYFLTAWVPPAKQQYDYYSHVTQPKGGGADIYTIGYMGKGVTLASGKSLQEQSTVYIGPEISKYLQPLAPGLQLTIDYGWLSPVSSIIFSIMSDIHGVIGNWGWSIILVTLLIKVLFYWPSAQSYKSMAKMRAVQPRLAALKERFGDDKQALSKATMEFYKKEKVNPMGGCLPMIIQIPVFFALYYVLIESVQLRQAPFMFWIHDLSIKDPYYVLPILMGITMFLQQKLSPAPPDPTQAKMMMLMPVVFTVVFLSFPAGLVLYWLTNNMLSIGQQWYVMKTFDPQKGSKKKR